MPPIDSYSFETSCGTLQVSFLYNLVYTKSLLLSRVKSHFKLQAVRKNLIKPSSNIVQLLYTGGLRKQANGLPDEEHRAGGTVSGQSISQFESTLSKNDAVYIFINKCEDMLLLCGSYQRRSL